MRLRIAKALPIFVPAVMLPGMAAFPCPGSRRISRLLCSSGFRFQYPRHFVGGCGCGVFLEIAGHDKDGIAHADFRHAVGAAGGAGVGLLVICLILSRLVDTFFSRISLTMQPPPKPHSTACVLPWEEGRHWQSRSSGCSSS